MQKPVGLHSFVRYVDELCARPEPYIRSLLCPRPVFMYLEKGNGRTTAARYAAVQLAQNHILPFCARTHCLEFNVNGSLAGFRMLADALGPGAGYVNQYDGVAALSLDTAVLTGHLNEACTTEFLDVLASASRHCLLLLFAEKPCPGAERVKNKLCSRMPELVCLPYEPYTPDELAAILQRQLEEQGLFLPCEDAVRKANITTVPELILLQRQLLMPDLLPAQSSASVT